MGRRDLLVLVERLGSATEADDARIHAALTRGLAQLVH